MKYIGMLALGICLVACKQKHNGMEVLTTLEDARNYVAESFENTEETLAISNNLMDPVGVNMAIIMDGVLAKGYMPEGFEQEDGYRVYQFRKD